MLFIELKNAVCTTHFKATTSHPFCFCLIRKPRQSLLITISYLFDRSSSILLYVHNDSRSRAALHSSHILPCRNLLDSAEEDALNERVKRKCGSRNQVKVRYYIWDHLTSNGSNLLHTNLIGAYHS